MSPLDVAMFAGQLTPAVTSAIAIVAPTDAPILAALLARMERTGNEKFEWYDQALPPVRSQVNNAGAAYDGATTSIVVDDGSVFPAGSLLYAEATGERIYVQARSGNTLTIVRGVGATTGAAGSVANNAWLRNIGHAAGEGTSTPDAYHGVPTKRSNYVQNFKLGVDITGRASVMDTLAPANQREFQRMMKFEEFRRQHERAVLFGSAADDVVDANGKKVTTTGGFYESLTTNVDNVGGTLSRSRLNQSALDYLFKYGSKVKTMYAGGTLVNTLHELWDQKIEVISGSSEVGLQIERYRTSSGVLLVIHHGDFDDGFDGDGLVVDWDDPLLKFRHTEKDGRDGKPHLNADVHQKSEDKKQDEWFSELGLQYGQESRHAIIKGVTGAAA